VRLLFLLIIAGVAAYFTNPPQERFEAEARALAEQGATLDDGQGITIDDIVGYAKGMMAGDGRYENLYLLGRYSVDLPGDEYIECFGAYTLVNCRVIEPGAAPSQAPAPAAAP
jgi:hypothetical protein